jgi:hypothetical protein
MSSEKPDQIQASVAAALSRLRGDLGPSGAAAPRVDTPSAQMGRDMARPANDVRGDPFFRSIQSAPPAEGGGPGGGRTPIPMTPFARMQAPQEPTPTETPPSGDPESGSEPTSTIEIPAMPERAPAPDLVSMPEPVSATQPAAAVATPPQPAPTAPAAPNSPLSRMMRGTAAETPSPNGPAQRDLLAGLPPPPISEPLTADTESNAMRRRRRNRRLLALAAVVVVAAIGAWLWTGSEKSTEVPVITADATPEKVKPADEGGLQVPNQNVQVLENMSGAPAASQGETVMPEPEQPVTPPASSEAEAPSAEQAPTVVENTAPDANSSAAVAPSEAPAVDSPPAAEAPLTTAPLPEQTENAAAEAAAAPPSPQPAAQPTPAAEAAAPAASDQAPAQEPAQATTQPAPAQPAPTPAPAPSATQEAAVTPAAPVGKTRVQLAAGKSEEAVKKDWAALQKAHPDLLGALTLNVERVDKGAAGIFYRLQAGPLADKNAAAKLCASLKQAHQDCIVVK